MANGLLIPSNNAKERNNEAWKERNNEEFNQRKIRKISA